MSVWLLSSGSGDDGDEWDLISIHSSLESALQAKQVYEARTGFLINDPEEWCVDEVLE